ncbi:hypothetical protein D9757_010650 [Collybiopsis confluens]|uniref:Manganese lipoxygenase n=1 Tax=Collybiopsis confluens TaxID=2823264 RepID=A0A8H5LS93_9AGAR|nr:hypothetical protein D9757_010650 [Collybiopsis confluens]
MFAVRRLRVVWVGGEGSAQIGEGCELARQKRAKYKACLFCAITRDFKASLSTTMANREDIVIVVMGCTGTGKSSLVRLLTGDSSVKVSDSLESETRAVKVVRFIDRTSRRNITIVDTPGFDDSRTDITDTIVLKEITAFMLNQYDNNRKVDGLVYLHRITDTRFGGQSNINLRMFQNLCGQDAYKNVVVLTTFWDQLNGTRLGEKRESELRTKIFSEPVQGGAIFMRHNRTMDSARKVLRHVLTLDPVDVQIVNEIRVQGKSLEETSAGSVHGEEVERLIAKHRQEITEIRKELSKVKEMTASTKRELEKLRNENKQKLARLENEKSDLKNGLEEETKMRKMLEVEAEKEGNLRKEWLLKRESRASIRSRGYDKRQLSLFEVPLDNPPPYEEALVSQDLSDGVFQFAYSDQYPPHIARIPSKYKTHVLDIFDFKSLLHTTVATFLLPDLTGLFDSNTVRTIDDLVYRNHRLHEKVRSETRRGPISQITLGMFHTKNIGHRSDWYTDAAFGQQQFTGVNPTTITLAPSRWVEEFEVVARDQGRDDITEILSSDPKALYVQDYSHFRTAVALPMDEEIKCDGRYGCSSVVLFHLEPNGMLHPLAITLDYKGSMQSSVTIINQRPESTTLGDESDDWPWRYAKMCAQVSDWFQHELVVHLVHTHLVEEVLIVAAHRTLPPSHIIFKLLEPHWTTTLSLNEDARNTLVPKIIVGMTAFTGRQACTFIKNAYSSFDWVGSYVPNDLERRGFPIEKLDDEKYHNYAYARNIFCMWEILRKFVGTVLEDTYAGGDQEVATDPAIAAFCGQVRSVDGGQLPSFPSVRTLDELIDFVTMCIHIASPQHTAVNYLQQYYQTFVPNKPAALYNPIPESLAELRNYGEDKLFSSLPDHRSREWLLMAQVPYLLSMEVAENGTILHYAATAVKSGATPAIRSAARVFKDDLELFAVTVSEYSDDLDDQQTPYHVLNPNRTAMSILI